MLSLALFALLTPQSEAQSLSDSTRSLTTLGVTIRDERVLDAVSGRIIRRTTDAVTGALVDGDALLLEESRAHDLKHSKISTELRVRLGDPKAELEVVFWLKPPAGQPDLRVYLDARIAEGQNREDARRSALAEASRHVKPLTARFTAALRSAGHEAGYVDAYVPIVFVTLQASAVAALATRADVDQVYYSFPDWMKESGASLPVPVVNEWASPSARTDYVHRKGIDGAGVKVMVNDVDNVQANTYLPPLVDGISRSTGSHATAVAGIISSHHSTHTGAAPGLTQLFNYGGAGDSNAPKAWSWAMGQGVSFGNCSWWNGNRGSIVFLDRYFDYIIRSFGVMMFKSCGNQGNGRPTTTPGNGFNTTASGNANDGNTHDWDDDGMASSSSTGNPQPSNHEKPELSAHGTGIYSTKSSGSVGSVGTGTSYASPVTCGSAALLAQTDFALKAKPEVVKAMLMAGAWNNIHGAAVLSDYDGAGAIDAAASQSAVANAQYVSTTLNAASFSGGFWTHTLQLEAGDATRIVALWFGKADSSYSSTVLQMDLDMVVLDPNGAVAASSASSANPFEIVGFTPKLTGSFTVRMQSQRFQGTTEPFALAWTTSQDTATNIVTIKGTPKIGQTITLEFFDRYHPGELYVGFVSAAAYPATWQIPNGKLIPIGFDALATASFQLPGFVGNLSANGLGTGQLPIPFVPQLTGLKVHAAMVTVQSGKPEAEEISSVTSFTLQ